MMKMKRVIADEVYTVKEMIDYLSEVDPDLTISDGCTNGYNIELFEHEDTGEQEIVMDAI